MAEEKSMFVCGRCGLGVHHCGDTSWKHLAGGRTARSCGAPPVLVRRDKHEAFLRDAFSALANRVGPK